MYRIPHNPNISHTAPSSPLASGDTGQVTQVGFEPGPGQRIGHPDVQRW